MSRRKLQSIKHLSSIEEPTVNLTPLIDVVFVILIMFIVVAPLLELDSVELANANSAASEESVAVSEKSPISIHVHKDNSLSFNSQSVSIDQLGELLKYAKQKYPQARPQLFHDRRAHFGVYQSVKNAAETAGFQQMDIVLKPA